MFAGNRNGRVFADSTITVCLPLTIRTRKPFNLVWLHSLAFALGVVGIFAQ